MNNFDKQHAQKMKQVDELLVQIKQGLVNIQRILSK